MMGSMICSVISGEVRVSGCIGGGTKESTGGKTIGSAAGDEGRGSGSTCTSTCGEGVGGGGAETKGSVGGGGGAADSAEVGGRE